MKQIANTNYEPDTWENEEGQQLRKKNDRNENENCTASQVLPQQTILGWMCGF